MPQATLLKPEIQQCVEDCLECHRICEETITYCLEKGGKHADPKHIRILRDCAEICKTAADFMLHGSELQPRTCAVCAEACELCAKSCEQFANNDIMQTCVEICRKCAESCRKLAS